MDIKQETINQNTHFWKVYKLILKECSDTAWSSLGHGYTTPDRLAYHIMQSSLLYMEYENSITMEKGKVFHKDIKEGKLEDLWIKAMNL